MLEAFIALEGQWRYRSIAMGPSVTMGLDHACVESTLRMMGYGERKRVKLFRLIRMMEREALQVIREREAEQHEASGQQ